MYYYPNTAYISHTFLLCHIFSGSATLKYARRLLSFPKRKIAKAVQRRSFANSIRPSDVFIVTYPKSGTTWLSFMIASILKTDTDEELNCHTFLKYVPDINDAYFKGGHLGQLSRQSDPRFFYVHAPCEPLFKKVIYIIRDPRDVMVSYYHFKLMTNARFFSSLKEFISCDNHCPCRWDKHVTGWLLHGHNSDICLLRYEEMKKDPAMALRRVLDFAGLAYTEADIKRAVEASTFQKMRSAELKHGLAGPEVLKNTNEHLVRRGKVGGWRDELDEESVRILEEKYGAVMRIVGYEPGE
jgi:estrone sulfotransferase